MVIAGIVVVVAIKKNNNNNGGDLFRMLNIDKETRIMILEAMLKSIYPAKNRKHWSQSYYTLYVYRARGQKGDSDILEFIDYETKKVRSL